MRNVLRGGTFRCAHEETWGEHQVGTGHVDVVVAEPRFSVNLANRPLILCIDRVSYATSSKWCGVASSCSETGR